MAELTEFKRMSFFTGFFTTADDWNQGQEYHQEKRRLHNRAMHTPGVMPGVGQEFRVEAAGGLQVRVLPGAALDGNGNEIYLGVSDTLGVDPSQSQTIYVATRYAERSTDYVENVDAPEYSGHTRVTETPVLELRDIAPDNQTWLELARIDLQEGVTEITDPADPDNPIGNEINRRYVVRAGSVGTGEAWLPPGPQQELIQRMRDKRKAFAALAGRFPVPPAEDLRHAALTVELLARAGGLLPEQVPDVLTTIADVEQDAGQELGTTYPALLNKVEYAVYLDAVGELLDALREGQGLDTLLTLQGSVTTAARELAEVVVRPLTAKIADKEDLGTVYTTGDEATVELDASQSQADVGQTIERYRWDKKE